MTAPPLPLDTSLYALKENQLAFFKAQTGIQDESELKNHILSVQAEAYAVYPYPCIRIFSFTWLMISKYPAYKDILKLGKERQGAILLDLGCCFGNDARVAIADGFPRENVIASDLHAEFWTLGHKLFKTTQESYPVHFIAGDVFDPSFLSATTPTTPPSPHPPLTTLKSLTPLQNHISIIHTAAFFHLFSESQQQELAHLLGTLLSPLSGSMIVGAHMGIPDSEENAAGGMRVSPRRGPVFAHSPTSWKELWVGKDGIFKPEEAIVWTAIREIERTDIVQEGGNPVLMKGHILIWSVTRV